MGEGRGLPVRTAGFLEFPTERPSHPVPREAISSSTCTQGQFPFPQSPWDRSGLLTLPPRHTDQSGVSSGSVRFISSREASLPAHLGVSTEAQGARQEGKRLAARNPADPVAHKGQGLPGRLSNCSPDASHAWPGTGAPLPHRCPHLGQQVLLRSAAGLEEPGSCGRVRRGRACATLTPLAQTEVARLPSGARSSQWLFWWLLPSVPHPRSHRWEPLTPR